MRKSFTLIEILVVLVIVGILATITTEILYKVYENYYISRTLNKLSFKTDAVLNNIAAKLTQRVPNSVIAVECNATNGDCQSGTVTSFKSVSLITPADVTRFPVLEWLAKDVYSKRGVFDSTKNYIVPGWAGFVDLIKTDTGTNDEYNITLPFSNFDIVKKLDSNWTDQWGVPNASQIFANKYEVLLFSGADDRGDFSEVNDSFGYYGNPAKNVFQIKSYTVTGDKTVANIQAITPSNTTIVYEGFYLINTAMAIVPVYNANTEDFNLTLRMNYYPWNGERYINGRDNNGILLATHVTQFRFREQNGIMRIYLCISDPKVKAGDEKITICKEKVVF